MSSATSVTKPHSPPWLAQVLGGSSLPAEGKTFMVRGVSLTMRGGILRSDSVVSDAQRQTERTFGFKWHQRDTFEGAAAVARARDWLVERYGRVSESEWIKEHGTCPLVLDAGCGAARAALELFGPWLGQVHYLGVDLSSAIDVAAASFAERGLEAGFLQADFNALPLAPGSVDLIFCEGALHHADSTEKAFDALAGLLKPGGRFMVYVYRRKGPIREFTDDHIRRQLQAMTPQDAWQAMMGMTKLGKVLGDLNLEIEIPEPIDALEIPAGKINLQRLFYWHVFKAYYRPDFSLEEMNHINFDWYAPRNCHRHTVEEVRAWCGKAGLTIERERVEEAGITMIARKSGD